MKLLLATLLLTSCTTPRCADFVDRAFGDTCMGADHGGMSVDEAYEDGFACAVEQVERCEGER